MLVSRCLHDILRTELKSSSLIRHLAEGSADQFKVDRVTWAGPVSGAGPDQIQPE